MKNNSKFDYRPAPFYFLNDRIDKKEISRQIALMKESNISGFFIHPRCGLTDPPYGSMEWFEINRFIAEETKKAGLKAWLYDEDAYPSGNLGGRIVFDNPELIAKSLKIVKVDVKNKVAKLKGLGKIKAIAAYGILSEGKDIKDVINLNECFGTVRHDWHMREINNSYYAELKEIPYRHIRSAAYHAEISFKATVPSDNYEVYAVYAEQVFVDNRFGCMADNLNKKTTNYFIKKTHQKYADVMSEYFGTVVPGIFTDEPVPGGFIPWTDTFDKEFYKIKGYPIQDNYFHLSQDFSPYSYTVRKDYFDVINALFEKNYYKPLAAFCKKNSLQLTGHCLCEEDPVSQTKFGFNVYSNLWHYDIPGFDIICNKIGGRDSISLSFGAKIVSSVAHQKGVKPVICECFAVNPFNFGYEGMKRIADWLFVTGINWLCPHGFYYGFGGMRKYDAGKSFFFQDKYFKDFPLFSAYAERTGRLLAEADESTNVCLIIPDWELSSYSPCCENKMKELSIKVFTATRQLFENHIGFDVTDCKRLLKSKVKDGKLVIGKMKYDCVVYVSDNTDVMQQIKKHLITNNVPFTQADNQGNINIIDLFSLGAHGLKLESCAGDIKNIFCYSKYNKDGNIYYMFNSGREYCKYNISLSQKKFAYVYDAQKDIYMQVDLKGNKAEVSLRGYDSLIIICTNKRFSAKGFYTAAEFSKDTVYEYEENPKWEYIPQQAVCALAKYDVEIIKNNNKWLYNNVKYGRIRNYHGTQDRSIIKDYEKPFYDCVPRMENLYPVTAVYKTAFKGAENLKLLLEEDSFSGNYNIFINGKKIDKNRYKKEFIYDFTNIIANITLEADKEENMLEIVFNNAEEFDGINSAIYLIK